MTIPNLFCFATKELSQDAFISWLASWANPACQSSNAPLHQAAITFLNRLLDIAKVAHPREYQSVVVKPQQHKIDVVILVNKDIVIVIEDKTKSLDHSNQLEEYREKIKKSFPDREVALIYLKTGDQCDYDRPAKLGYGCFLRSHFLEVLDQGIAAGVTNAIFVDFRDHLRRIEDEVNGYSTTPIHDWNRNHWRGFFMELQKHLPDGDWATRGHGGGGSLTMRWHRKGDKLLVLDKHALAFKLEAADKSTQRDKRRAWERALQAKNGFAGITIALPARRALGKRMTVAVLAGEYLHTHADGRLDLEKTVVVLRNAERFADAALSTSDASSHGQRADGHIP